MQNRPSLGSIGKLEGKLNKWVGRCQQYTWPVEGRPGCQLRREHVYGSSRKHADRIGSGFAEARNASLMRGSTSSRNPTFQRAVVRSTPAQRQSNINSAIEGARKKVTDAEAAGDSAAAAQYRRRLQYLESKSGGLPTSHSTSDRAGQQSSKTTSAASGGDGIKRVPKGRSDGGQFTK